MKKKNLLFVSIAFPPKNDAEGLQVAKYLKYIIREGYNQFNIDVVTSKVNTLNMFHDLSLEHSAIGIRQSIELPIFENRYINFFFKKIIPIILHLPDSKFMFHLQSYKIPRLLQEYPDLIYSRSFPTSSAVMAYKLKQYYKIPWIMHLSDLWADCPFTPYNGKYCQKIERKCFELADIISVTSESTCEFYKKKYQYLSEKIVFFPNVFDLENTKTFFSPYKREKLRIVYTGSFAGTRSPAFFLEAVSILPEEKKEKIEVIFSGDIDRKNLSVINRYQNNNWFSYYGIVEYASSLELQCSADVLLLIDSPVEQQHLRVFFPSKILDYILARRPILALVYSESETERVVKNNMLGTSIEYNDVTSISNHLSWLVESKGSEYFDNRSIIPMYEAAYNAKRLIKLFNSTLADKNEQINNYY